MKLKDKIKSEYTKQGYSLAEFAKELGMSPSNLGNQINRDDTVQLGLIKKICQALAINVGSLLERDFQHSNSEEEQMIFDQLKAILDGGDEDTVDLIVGKITREYGRVQQKKDFSRKRAAHGE